jgi:two-component system, NarL family, nitrate/nitrite response regulator NarL
MAPGNRRIRILVADDSRKALLSVCKYLEFEGNFEIVATATDGQQLLRKTQIYRPDLVLTDLSIPRINGLQAAILLRRTFPKLRIIIFTELTGLSLRDECLRSGADGFVEKSQMPEKLMEEVRRLFPDEPAQQ